MIDVFVRTMAWQNPLRTGLATATEARWKMDPLACVRPLANFPIRLGRAHAERSAESDIYIFTDDDVLPVGRNWIARGLEAMLANPEYAICSTLSLIEGENLAKPPENAGSIYPMHAVGAPMWIRKGILSDLPEMTLNSECGVIDDYVKAKGFKEGLFNCHVTGMRHLHLGHGFSSTPGLDFGA